MSKLPYVTSQIPRDLRTFLERVREAISGTGGAQLVSAQDLIDAGLVSLSAKGTLSATNTNTNYGTPPAPEHVATSGALGAILVTWDEPLYQGHLYAEVWGASTNSLGSAVVIGLAPGAVYSDAIGSGATRYYWVRFVNQDGTAGPYNGTNGTAGTAGTDPSYLLDVLTGEISETELATHLNDRIDLVDGSHETPGTIPYQLALLQGQIDNLSTTPAYDNSTTYSTGDIVQYDGAIYQALSSTTGHLPTNTTYWLKIGDYNSLGSAVAAHSVSISTLTSDLGAETSARESLATQMRGSYSGTDLASVTSGLLYSEKTTRASADSALSSSITALSSTVSGHTTDIANNTSAINTNTAAISSEATTRANADSALSSSVSSLSSTVSTHTTQIGTNTTNISTNAAAISSEASTRASETGALSTSVTSLSSTVSTHTTQIANNTSAINTNTTNIATNAAAITSEASTRASADSALASSVSTLSTTVGGYSAAISANTAAVDGVKAQYALKIDNNGYVSGFGLTSSLIDGGAATSTFYVSTDRFAVATPASSLANWVSTTVYAIGKIVAIPGNTDKMLVCKLAGTSGSSSPSIAGVIGSLVVDGSVTWQVASRIPLSAVTSQTTINGISVQPGVYIDGAAITNATINNAQIAALAVDDAKISSLNVNKLKAGAMSVGEYIESSNFISGGQGWHIDANGTAEFQNAVVRGTVYATTGSFTGTVFATDGKFTGEVVSQDSVGNKARLFSGNIEVYKYVPNIGTVLYKALSRAEYGTASNNATVVIPGYFLSQPKIIVTPANIMLYRAAYAAQDQSLQCQALNIAESPVGSMKWQFVPVATLSLAANTGLTTINQTSGSTPIDSWTSSSYVTPANTSSFNPTVTINSNRGNGASQYYYRTVRFRPEYYDPNSGTWQAGGWSSANLGGDTNASATLNMNMNFPTAGSWTIRVYAEAYDTGSGVFGAISYDYATDTATRSGQVVVNLYYGDSQYGNYVNQALDYSVSYSVPSGWSVTSCAYTWTAAYQLINPQGTAYTNITGNRTGGWPSGTYSATNYSYNTGTSTQLRFTLTNQKTVIGSGTASTAYMSVTSASATIQRRKPSINSTTPNNTFSFGSYTYALTNAQVLATGSLNWLAIGE